MFRLILKSKIHRATVTETKLDYEGSITIDEELLKRVDILPGERVEVFNLTSGARFSTYAIKGEKDKGEICINGAAARLAQVGDRVIVICYALANEEESKSLKPRIIVLDEKNRVLEEGI